MICTSKRVEGEKRNKKKKWDEMETIKNREWTCIPLRGGDDRQHQCNDFGRA